jgi:acetyl-CoA synthetase
VPHPLKGETIWCFVVVKPGVEPAPALATRLRNVVAEHLGRSFLPSKVVFVPELPKTRSAKIVRRVIRAVALAEDTGDLSSLEDPGSLDGIRRALETPS